MNKDISSFIIGIFLITFSVCETSKSTTAKVKTGTSSITTQSSKGSNLSLLGSAEDHNKTEHTFGSSGHNSNDSANSTTFPTKIESDKKAEVKEFGIHKLVTPTKSIGISTEKSIKLASSKTTEKPLHEFTTMHTHSPSTKGDVEHNHTAGFLETHIKSTKHELPHKSKVKKSKKVKHLTIRDETDSSEDIIAEKKKKKLSVLKRAKMHYKPHTISRAQYEKLKKRYQEFAKENRIRRRNKCRQSDECCQRRKKNKGRKRKLMNPHMHQLLKHARKQNSKQGRKMKRKKQRKTSIFEKRAHYKEKAMNKKNRDSYEDMSPERRKRSVGNDPMEFEDKSPLNPNPASEDPMEKYFKFRSFSPDTSAVKPEVPLSNGGDISSLETTNDAGPNVKEHGTI